MSCPGQNRIVTSMGSFRCRRASPRTFYRGLSSTISWGPAGLAQLVEHLICNHEVASSILAPGSTIPPACRPFPVEARSRNRSGVHEVSTGRASSQVGSGKSCAHVFGGDPVIAQAPVEGTP